MTGPRTVSVPASAAGLRQATEAVEAFSASLALPGPLRRSLLTVLDEVLANIVGHGMAGGAGAIDVAMSCAGGTVTVEVVDPGAPFNPLLAPAPDTASPLEGRRIGGLGIALVRAMTDEVEYARREGRNRVTLRWHRAGVRPANDGHDAD
jgi:serine/threonine-protein kinase RsbW